MGINWNDLDIKKLSQAEAIHIEFKKTAERILEILAEHTDDGLPEKQISERAKARKQRFVKTLRKLVQIKSLTRMGKGTKKEPYRYLYCTEQPTVQIDDEKSREHQF